MAAINDTVRPGDVISSDLIARMIGLINAHDAQLANLGSGTPPTNNLLAGFDPPVQQNVGGTLHVFGTFDIPISSNTLTIDGLPIASSTFLPGSNNSQLVFIIPSSLSVPASGTRRVTVHLSNTQGEGELQFTLLPPVAGPPNPTLNTVEDADTSAAILRSGQNARITGVNFLSPPANNRVRLIFGTGTNQVIFPATGNSLVVVASGSVINPAPQTSTLIVTMPTNTELAPVIAQVGGVGTAVLEFTVPGAAAPATRSVTIRRLSTS